MSYSSRRAHWCPSCHGLTVHTDSWKKVAWSDESRFQLPYSHGLVRIWYKEQEHVDPSCFVSKVQVDYGVVVVWGYFLGALWAPQYEVVPKEKCPVSVCLTWLFVKITVVIVCFKIKKIEFNINTKSPKVRHKKMAILHPFSQRKSHIWNSLGAAFCVLCFFPHLIIHFRLFKNQRLEKVNKGKSLPNKEDTALHHEARWRNGIL